jgi:hypothetical protein
VDAWGLGLACEGVAVHGQSVKSILRIRMHGDKLHSAISSKSMGWLMHRYNFDATK